MGILIKEVELNNAIQDILIVGNQIVDIGVGLQATADKIINGRGKAAVPGMINGHTHAGMTLMRGYADDMPLMPWLEQKIWPLEAKLSEEDVYWGTKLACLEMIKTGTTSMVDMYHYFFGTAKAFDEMGLRGLIASAGFDFGKDEMAEAYKGNVQHFAKQMGNYSNRLKLALGPHAIYSVSTNMLKWIRDFARDNGLKIHTHLSETTGEVENCLRDFGMRPVHYLQSIGFLSEDVSLAHCLYLDDEEIKVLADQGCQVVHNPASNLKLVSGNRFPMPSMQKAGLTVCLGTDGPCSGNNLDMYETMKLASLMGKAAWGDPAIWDAQTTFDAATKSGAQLIGFDTGAIEIGKLADICLVNMHLPEMTPCFNLVSNLVYAANGNVVDTVICDGKILMENRYVQGEEEIMQKASAVAHNLVKRIEQ